MKNFEGGGLGGPKILYAEFLRVPFLHLSYFCHLDFVKEFPRVGCKISAKIGESWLISAKIGQNSTQL